MCMYMCTLTSSLGPAFRTARVVYRVSGYIHKGAHTTAAACGMLILFILECAAEECAANFNGVSYFQLHTKTNRLVTKAGFSRSAFTSSCSIRLVDV